MRRTVIEGRAHRFICPDTSITQQPGQTVPWLLPDPLFAPNVSWFHGSWSVVEGPIGLFMRTDTRDLTQGCPSAWQESIDHSPVRDNHHMENRDRDNASESTSWMLLKHLNNDEVTRWRRRKRRKRTEKDEEVEEVKSLMTAWQIQMRWQQRVAFKAIPCTSRAHCFIDHPFILWTAIENLSTRKYRVSESVSNTSSFKGRIHSRYVHFYLQRLLGLGDAFARHQSVLFGVCQGVQSSTEKQATMRCNRSSIWDLRQSSDLRIGSNAEKCSRIGKTLSVGVQYAQHA